MPKKVCPNGHIYDSSIYGDDCPLCPKGDNETQYVAQPGSGMSPYSQMPSESAGGTHVTSPAGDSNQPFGGAAPMSGGPAVYGSNDAIGETKIHQQNYQQNNQQTQQRPVGGGTVIRPPKGTASTQGRKLVGFLVTYNRNPLGKSYNIYEGKNYIGRDRSCDISVPEDNQMSSRHMSILYRNVDNKFKYRDEQSSNGTFVNKELSDEGELQNYDIIRLGGTVFIFIAIPKLS